MPSLPEEYRVLPSGENTASRTMLVCPSRTPSDLPVVGSHSRTVLSQPPEASVFPSRENVTKLTSAVWPLQILFTSHVVVSQSNTKPSIPADASVLPSGENATPRTSLVCPLSERVSLPVAVSQILIAVSWLVAASSLLSGENATATTMSRWPSKTCRSLSLSASQMRTVPSLLPEASNNGWFTALENARQVIVCLWPLRVAAGFSCDKPVRGARANARITADVSRFMGEVSLRVRSSRPRQLHQQPLELRPFRKLAAPAQAHLHVEQPIVNAIEPAATEVPHLRLGVAKAERGNADLLEGGADVHSLVGEPVRLGEPAQLHAEGAEDAEGVFALLEQAVEDRQAVLEVAGRDRVEDLPSILRPAMADEAVDVGQLDARAVGDVGRELGDLLVEQAHLGADQLDEQRRGLRGQLLAVLGFCPFAAPSGDTEWLRRL